MKRRFFLLSMVLAGAIALFGAYLILLRSFRDMVPPVICVEEELLEIPVAEQGERLMTGITAMDDRDGDVTATLLVEGICGITEDHVTTVTYAAFDRAGNVSKLRRRVRFRDYREPRFELSASLCFPAHSGFELLDHVGAWDVLEGDISRRVRATLVSDTRSIDEIGSHVVRLQVTNSLGDMVQMDFPVEVYDPDWYSASVRLEQYLIYLKRGDAFDPEVFLSAFCGRGGDTDLSQGIPSNMICHVDSNVNTGEPGIYRVKYTLTETAELNPLSGQAVLVVIVQE